MRNKIITLLAVLSAAFFAQGQTGWAGFDKLMQEGSYKSAYELAAGVYKKSATGAERLAAAYHMTQAAANYQEDVRDSAEARYRQLLPSLEPLEKALCLTFLGEYDSALVYSEVLKRTPVEKIKMYCNAEKGVGMTPTAYDVVVLRILGDYDKTTVQRRVELQRMLVEFHAGDGDDIRIWNESRLLDYLSAVPNRPMPLERIREAIEKFRGTKSVYYTLLYERAARWCGSKDDNVTALRYCDTAIQLAPRSEGGVECANLKNEILLKSISFEGQGLWIVPGQPSLQKVRYRNVDKLYYRIVNYFDDYRWGDKTKAKLLAEKVVCSGEWKVESGKEYKYAESYVSLPALKAGRWLLLVSPSEDFKADGFMAYEINCSDMLLLHNHHHGLLLDRRTGCPIAGQKMRVERHRYNEKVKVLATTETDRDGRYRFDLEEAMWSDKVVIERDGYRLETRYNYNGARPDSTMRLQAQLRFDRPIYKPGDTVHMALVVFRSNGLEAAAAAGERVMVALCDPNDQAVDTVALKTDDFGMTSASMVISTDRIAGVWHVRNVGEGKVRIWESVRVEEYKQPKFMVTLGTGGGVAPQFGTPCTVQGLAASYSAVPVSGAKVKYSVVRRQLSRWWWRWLSYDSEAEVAQGETTTAADGSFSVSFTPEPDSSVELSGKPSFEYEVRADVTDINGESHYAVSSLRVGFRNAIVYLEAGSTPGDLKVKHTDLNGNPLAGAVKTKVELLRQPATPRLDSPLLEKGVQHTMTEAEWNKAFPLLAYGIEYNDPSQWSAVSGQWSVESGVYRVTISADDADTVTDYITYVSSDAKKVPSQQLLWAETDKSKAEVGETVRLRFGSRFKDVEVYYLLRVGNDERAFRRIKLSDEIKSIDIAVDSSMLGGFQVDLVSVREGVESLWCQSVEVPFSHKRLKMEIATFRDKLLPGEQEEWTVSVKSDELGVKSAMVLAMYDDALNSYYGKQSWEVAPWRTNGSSVIPPLHVSGGVGHWMKDRKYLYYQGVAPAVWMLKEALPSYNRWGGRRMYKSARAFSNNVQEEEEVVLSVVEDIAVAETASSKAVAAGGENGEQKEKSQVRTNLNTLAFFAPALRTDKDGTVTYRFTVPELLTRWNVRGLAITKDIKTGTLDRTLVTQKPLMVQPNMPRFLRCGDSLSLMAKIVCSGECEEEGEIEVDFRLLDAATGDILCHDIEHVRVKDAAQVKFNVEVPQNVYVVTYRIVAHAEGMSDGEQGQVPVVTNRQAVTVSQAMYINGAGEKRYTMPEWLVRSDNREPRLVAAEVTSNPVWLAIKCMPYLKVQENPSTLYLANQLYVNSKGRELVELVNLDNLDKLGGSRLKMNEDVKQTLLKATPWVQDAESEEEQMAAVANYFDKTKLNAEFQGLTSDLTSRQNPDGGWSWMPDGKSSLWVTQQVLKKIATGSRLSAVGEKALEYVDLEQQRYYDKYIKPYLKKGYKWQPTDIDYLYTRSFYVKDERDRKGANGFKETEAYKFYYANALKGYKQYETLYTQAQLALIFYRHGDKKQALDLLRRIKEKALVNDEMGMYWRDNTSGWFWYQRPISTQALLIQAFAEITPDDRQTIGLMQQWLLKQKQTTRWDNESSTTDAISALMVGGGEKVKAEGNAVEMNVFGVEMTADAQGKEGYRSQRWTGDELDTLITRHSSLITLRKQDDGIAWGAVYYQFADDMDKIPASEMGIKLKRSYIAPKELHVGDKIKVRIDIQCDRAMEYLELIDGRPSCVEPLSTRAGWRWTDGLSYYITVNNTDTRCYIEHIDKGKYYFEYEVYVTNPGHFMAGPVTMQCMYAPEFRAVAPGQTLVVEP